MNRFYITLGDSGGIGAEVVFKSLLELASLPETDSVKWVLVGPRRHWDFHAASLLQHHPHLTGSFTLLGDRLEWLEVETTEEVVLGQNTAEQGRIAYECIARSVSKLLAGEGIALITAPLSKTSLHLAGYHYPGQTELLGELTNTPNPTMAFHGGGLTIALATVHVALRAVPDLIQIPLLHHRLGHLSALSKALGKKEPVIGVCGLNPHASEDGLFGDEEARVITPAMKQYSEPGVTLKGPLPGDTAFLSALEGELDAVLALYHDQGLAALKTHAFDEAVNTTLGLPFVRTSPDHGTAYNLAGKGIARHQSMLAALRLALQLGPRLNQLHR